MSRPSSIRTRFTVRPAGPVCAVTRWTPSMCEAISAASSGECASVNLRFDNDHVGFESGRAFAGFFLRKSHFAAWNGDTVTRENGLGLILMNLHRGSVVLEFWCRPKH